MNLEEFDLDNLKVVKPAKPDGSFVSTRLQKRNSETLRNEAFTLKNILEEYQEGTLNIKPVFQRDFVWDYGQQVGLILSYLSGNHELIPPIYISRIENSAELSYEDRLVDGQQRITTILDFMQNKFALNVQNSITGEWVFRNCFFKNLPAKVRNDLIKQKVRAVVVLGLSPLQEEKLFFHLNNGKPLTKGEMYHSASNQINEVVKDCIKLGVFGKEVFKSKERDRSG